MKKFGFVFGLLMLASTAFGQVSFQQVDIGAGGVTAIVETWKTQIGPNTANGGQWLWGAAAIDYDGDGDSDIILTSHNATPTGVPDSILLRNEFVPSGTLSFTDVTASAFGAGVKTFNSNKPNVWDLNGDGKWDLLCGEVGTSRINQGNGTFLSNGQNIIGSDRKMTVKDINGDGIKDYTFMYLDNVYGLGKRYTCLGTASGVFTVTNAVVSLPSETPQSVKDKLMASLALNNTTTQYNRFHSVDYDVVDFNGDGKQDLLVTFDGGYEGDVWSAICVRDANNILQEVTVASGLPSTKCSIVSTKDANGDGMLDVLVCGGGVTKSGLWLQAANGTFSNSANADIADFMKVIPAYVPHSWWEDLDKDGDLDLGVSMLRSGVGRVWENIGNGVFVQRINATHWDADGMYIRSRGGYACDFNNDGLTDVLTVGTGTNHTSSSPIIAWLNTSHPTNPNPVPTPTAPEITLSVGGVGLADGGNIDFGTTAFGTNVDKTVIVKNDGNAVLNLQNLGNAPTGFVVATNLGTTSIQPGQTTTFVLRMNGSSSGSFSGVIALSSNDADEGTYEINLTGTVSAPPPPMVGNFVLKLNGTQTILAPTTEVKIDGVVVPPPSGPADKIIEINEVPVAPPPPPSNTGLRGTIPSFGLSTTSPDWANYTTLVNARVSGTNVYSYGISQVLLWWDTDGRRNDAARNWAVTEFRSQLASNMAKWNANEDLNGFSDNQYLYAATMFRDWVLVLNWASDQLTATEKSNAEMILARCVENLRATPNPATGMVPATWGNGSFPWAGWSQSNPGNNYYYAHLECVVLWALHSKDQKWVDHLHNVMFPALTNYYANLEGSREGTFYGIAQKDLFRTIWMWKQATGEYIDVKPAGHIKYWIAVVTPDYKFHAPIGDQPMVSMPEMTSANGDYHRAVILWAARLVDSPEARYWLAHDTHTHHFIDYWFLSCDPIPGISTKPSSDTYHSVGTGHLIATDSDGSMLVNTAGDVTEAHAGQIQGEVQFYHDGEWKLATSNIWSFSGILQDMKYHCVPQIGNNQNIQNLCSLQYSDNNGKLSVSANLNGAYGQEVARIVTWDRPNKNFTVQDSVGNSRWFVNTKPVASGDTITAGTITFKRACSSPPNIVDMDTVNPDEFNPTTPGPWMVEFVGAGVTTISY